MPAMTPCECSGPGFCERHQCVKNDYFYHQCRRNPEAFQEWEDGHGPCLTVPPEDGEASIPDAERTGPGFLRRAMNFGAALARHSANQLKTVTDTFYESRLATCRQCSSCDIQRMVCQEKSCGCFLQTKARWESESCPLHKWEQVPQTSAPP